MPTTPCGASPWPACTATHPPGPTSSAAPNKACPSSTSCAVSSATSPARSIPTSPAHHPPLPLAQKRRHQRTSRRRTVAGRRAWPGPPQPRPLGSAHAVMVPGVGLRKGVRRWRSLLVPVSVHYRPGPYARGGLAMLDQREEILKTLRATPVVLRALVGEIENDRLRTRPAAGEWAIIEVVSHLADTEERALARVRRMLAEDNPELELFDQEALA